LRLAASAAAARTALLLLLLLLNLLIFPIWIVYSVIALCIIFYSGTHPLGL
jgi:hypothetical protein